MRLLTNDIWCPLSLTIDLTFSGYVLSLIHTHTHPFNGPFSGTTRVSPYQKGKTKLDFTAARDSEWQWHQLGRMQVCTSLQTDNLASTPRLSFLQAGCPSCRPTNSVKALKALSLICQQLKSSRRSLVSNLSVSPCRRPARDYYCLLRQSSTTYNCISTVPTSVLTAEAAFILERGETARHN